MPLGRFALCRIAPLDMFNSYENRNTSPQLLALLRCRNDIKLRKRQQLVIGN